MSIPENSARAAKKLKSRPLIPTRDRGIYKRGNSFVLRVRDPRTGRERKIAHHSADALLKVQAGIRLDPSILDRVEAELATTKGSPLVRDYFEGWIRRYEGRGRNGIRPETRREYEADIKNHVLPEIGHLRMNQLTTPRLVQMVTALERKHWTPRGNSTKPPAKLSPATVRKAFRAFHAMLATAREEGLIEHNPAQGIRMPSGRKVRGRPMTLDAEDEMGDTPGVPALSDEELALLIAKTPDDERYIPTLLARTGLRASELMALRWRHIDFETAQLRVVERRRPTGTARPKSQRSARAVPLSPASIEMLRAIRDRRSADGDDYVALSPRGKPLNYGNFRRRTWLPAATAAGIPWAGLHTLRHTCATNLLRRGTPIHHVSRWLGHSETAFTADVYTHLEVADLPDPSLLD